MGSMDYKIEGDYLLTDEATVSILYTGRIDDTESYDVHLRQAITWQLVADLAYVFTGSAATAKELIAMANATIQDLQNQNGSQGSGDDISADTFTNIRR